MTKTIVKFSLLSLLTLAIAGLPGRVGAQDHSTPPGKENKEKKPNGMQFHGKLKAVDATAKTITVDELTLRITSETKIIKGANPATFADLAVGENVNGAYKKADDGTLQALKIHVGVKQGPGHPKEGSSPGHPKSGGPESDRPQ
jgi:Domain of unknown function (DUF5666)